MTKDESIEKVSEAKKNYYQKCYHFALNFIRNEKEEFSSENIINKYLRTDNPEPSEPRVWGAVMRDLSRNNLITFVGYQKYRNPKGHQKPSAVWISLISKNK